MSSRRTFFWVRHASDAPTSRSTLQRKPSSTSNSPCRALLGLPGDSGHMRVHLINPSHVSFGTAVITPRWLYVLAAATPKSFGDPILVDETLALTDPERIAPGDVVGIGIHTANALRGYELGKMARSRGAYVVFGGIHATLYPQESLELGAAHAVVEGDGDVIWPSVLADCAQGAPLKIYAGGRVEAEDFKPARWDLVPRN